jgi:hypothetical protein
VTQAARATHPPPFLAGVRTLPHLRLQ